MVIPQVEYAYNDSVNKIMGRNPFEVVYGMHPRDVCELKDLGAMEYRSGHAKDFTQTMKNIQEWVKRMIQETT